MRLITIATLLFLFISCSKLELKTPLAFYIRPNTVNTTTLSNQGTTSHKITDMWFYVNGFFKGAYPIGSILPVVSNGSAEIIIYPGIKNNGISETRQPYEFYAPLQIDTVVSSNITVQRNLSFKYKSGTVFHYIEDFDGSGIGFKTSQASDLPKFRVLNDPTNLYEGKYMYFSLEGDTVNGYFESAMSYNLPLNGAPVYMELNYKCNQPFVVGVCNGWDYRTALTINRSDNWNKIYVQLSSAVSTSPTYGQYGIFIRAIKQSDIQKAEFYIDNVKLISY